MSTSTLLFQQLFLSVFLYLLENQIQTKDAKMLKCLFLRKQQFCSKDEKLTCTILLQKSNEYVKWSPWGASVITTLHLYYI